jgi:hypothetical protein
MKTKIYSVIGTIAFLFFLGLNFIIEKDKATGDLTLIELQQTASADIEIPIDTGDANCVCNDGICQDRNWISFRTYCGTPNGGASDESCSVYSYNCN